MLTQLGSATKSMFETTYTTHRITLHNERVWTTGNSQQQTIITRTTNDNLSQLTPYASSVRSMNSAMIAQSTIVRASYCVGG